MLVVNDDMDDERSQLNSTMYDLSVDLSDPHHSQPTPCRLQHTHAPSPTRRTPSPSLPEIPAADLDLTCSFDSIMGTSPEKP